MYTNHTAKYILNKGNRSNYGELYQLKEANSQFVYTYLEFFHIIIYAMSYEILLIDNDYFFRREFSKQFSEYLIIESANSKFALSVLNGPNMIDLILLNVDLPDMNGITLLKRIKLKYPDKLIILMANSNISSKSLILEALRAHADDYIETPLKISILREIIHKLLKKQERSKLETDSIHDKIDYIKAFIEKNYDKNVSLEEASKRIYLSPKYFGRIFKEKTGINFYAYKIAIKMQRAIDFIVHTNYNINEIAGKIGYKNTESFSRVFKNIKGISPKEYRKQFKSI